MGHPVLIKRCRRRLSCHDIKVLDNFFSPCTTSICSPDLDVFLQPCDPDFVASLPWNAEKDDVEFVDLVTSGCTKGPAEMARGEALFMVPCKPSMPVYLCQFGPQFLSLNHHHTSCTARVLAQSNRGNDAPAQGRLAPFAAPTWSSNHRRYSRFSSYTPILSLETSSFALSFCWTRIALCFREFVAAALSGVFIKRGGPVSSSLHGPPLPFSCDVPEHPVGCVVLNDS